MLDAGARLQQLAGRLRFGLIDLLRGTRSLSLLRELETLQFAPPEMLRARQQALLERYVRTVRAASPLYADYADFSDFPVIDKVFANAHRARLFNTAYRGKVLRKKTGGSTGEPFVYSTGVLAQSYLWAAIWLSWRVAGYRLGEPVAFLAGTALFGTGYKQKLYYQLMNVRLFSAFDLSAARLDGYADAIACSKCRLLYGYASAIHRLALHLLQMRATIERAFAAPCFSQYGCNDAGVSAYECERRDGFHLITERSYFEVLADGRLVSTDLANQAFFLPRYDTGDRVDMASRPCACGRGFPLIQSVLGRSNDIVHDARGNAVHSEFFTHLFREDARIGAFQVIYDEAELAVIVHCSDPAFAHPPYLERIAQALVFERVRFAVNQAFVAIHNGKHRFVLRVDKVSQLLDDPVPVAP